MVYLEGLPSFGLNSVSFRHFFVFATSRRMLFIHWTNFNSPSEPVVSISTSYRLSDRFSPTTAITLLGSLFALGSLQGQSISRHDVEVDIVFVCYPGISTFVTQFIIRCVSCGVIAWSEEKPR